MRSFGFGSFGSEDFVILIPGSPKPAERQAKHSQGLVLGVRNLLERCMSRNQTARLRYLNRVLGFGVATAFFFETFAFLFVCVAVC